MLLAIDAGNTNIVFALYKGEEQQFMWRYKTDSGRTADEYRAWLGQLFDLEKLTFRMVHDVIISSVVPNVNPHLKALCENAFGCKPLFINSSNAGVDIQLARPEQVGADRLVNIACVLKDYSCPAIILDFGTATTFDVINENGQYIGGAIAPGVNLSMTALHQAAAQLPSINIERADKVIGNDTITAMQSGIYWGYVGMIEGMITRIIDEMGCKPLVIATGGLSTLFADTIPMIQKVDKDLTLRGLLHIFQNIKTDKAA